MSIHPNVILCCTLRPDGLSRKTMREILKRAGVAEDEDEPSIKIEDEDYNILVLEENYDDGWQLSGKEGDILVFDLVTYGYGESISWDDLSEQKNDLEQWAKETCEALHCTYSISVTANYW